MPHPPQFHSRSILVNGQPTYKGGDYKGRKFEGLLFKAWLVSCVGTRFPALTCPLARFELIRL